MTTFETTAPGPYSVVLPRGPIEVQTFADALLLLDDAPEARVVDGLGRDLLLNGEDGKTRVAPDVGELVTTREHLDGSGAVLRRGQAVRLGASRALWEVERFTPTEVVLVRPLGADVRVRQVHPSRVRIIAERWVDRPARL